MTSRPILAIAAASILISACGGDSEGANTTIPEVTLLTTTTEAPIFAEGDGDVPPPSAAAVPDDSAPTTLETDVSTTIAVATTVVAPITADTAVVADTTAPVVADTTPAEPAATPAAGDFVLGADGLGAIQFGADPEQTITFVDSVLGAPTSDTGWVDPFEIGPCGGTRIRQVSWSQLQLEFGDVSDVTSGRDHLYAYFYGAEGSSTPQPAGLQTAEKVGAGSSITELLTAYPGVTLLQGDEFIGPSFTVNDNLTGRMSGIADDDVVEMVIGGRPCDG